LPAAAKLRSPILHGIRAENLGEKRFELDPVLDALTVCGVRRMIDQFGVANCGTKGAP